MKKELFYWATVVVFAYAIVVTIDTISVKFYRWSDPNKDVLAYSEDYAKTSQIEPNHKISSVFDKIINKSLFIPKVISIAPIGIFNAPIMTVGIKDNGAMEVPTNPEIVGWYKNGPVSGEVGNIVLAGHYDWLNGEKGVFYKLNSVKIGDEISISNDNSVLRYIVYETLYVPNNDTGAVAIAFRDSANQELTIITCGGVWDNITGSYDKRFLVKALLVE